MIRTLTALSLAVAAIGGAAALAPAPAGARLLDSGRTCEAESRYSRQFCAMPTRYGVYIKDQLSSIPCIRGRNWWVRRGGVVVAHGCRAVFMPRFARRPDTGF